MATLRSQPPEIFIGAKVEHASERALLEEAFRVISQKGRPAVVLANVNLNGRQIDAILALDDLTVVIEVKGYSRPIRGGENGAWQVRLASGAWKDCENPYLQVLGAKNRLRDAMRPFCDSDSNYYPSAAVVFVPDIPAGSSICAGDFKVSLVGLKGLYAEMQKRHSGCWNLDQWRAFTQHHRLLSVSSVEAACSPELFGAEQLLARYSSEYLRTYAADAAELVTYTCQSGNEKITSDEVIDLITKGADSILIGPSGCGKSLLAACAGVSFLQSGGVPITIQAKEYQGNLKDTFDREAGLLSNCSGTALLASARRLGRPILLIVDGYNECQDDRRASLTRAIAALSRRYECGVMVTSQVALARQNLLPLREIQVPLPSREVKVTIANRASTEQALSKEMESLVESVASGLEANIVGEVGNQVNTGVSRYALFDAYARKRLARQATEGIHALSEIAGWLSDHVTFSISVRDLDRLVYTEHIAPSLVPHLTANNLLHSRGDRVSFGHELFLNAFASEALVRRAVGSAERIAAALKSPRHANRKELILGAIDDDGLLVRVLEQVSDPSIIASCMSGSCGRLAREWAEARYPKLLSRMRAEVEILTFSIAGQDQGYVDIDPCPLEPWTKLDLAFVDCIPDLLAQGRFLAEILELVAAMDRRIGEETARLRGEARARKVSLRSSIFASSYVTPPSSAPALARVCSRMHGRLFRNVCNGLDEEIQRRMERTDCSPGQLYLLLTLCRQLGDVSPIVAPFVTWAIQEYWTKAPGHLRLVIVDVAGFCRDAGEPERSALVTAVEPLLNDNNPLLNGLIFDVLQRLDAFEQEELEHSQSVREHVDQLLSRPDDREKCAEAYTIYLSQFDHPYSMAYYEVVNGLPEEQRKELLIMAAKGAPDDTQLFTSLLILEVASFNDPCVGEIISRWTAPPPVDSFMPQDAVEAFVLAHIALARLGCELSNCRAKTDSSATNALLASGDVLYWSNRLDLSEDERRAACLEAWTILSKHDRGAALNAIRDCAHVNLRWGKKLPGTDPVRTSGVRAVDWRG